MDATVAVAALGFVSTLLAAWLTARWQTRGLVTTELVSARVQAYGEAAQAFYELERVSFNRAITRFRDAGPDDAELAQAVYKQNSATRAAIGRLAILSREPDLWKDLNALRGEVRGMHDLRDEDALRTKHDEVMDKLNGLFANVRNEFDDFQG
jgi:hypothetical protein